MADNTSKDKEEGAEGTAEAAPAKSKKMLFIIIGAVVLLIVAIGVPVFFMMSKTQPQGTEELAADAAAEESGLVPAGHDDEEELVEGEEPLGSIFPLETFIVNLNGGKYIRLQVQVEFSGQDIPRRFYSRLVLVRDAIINLLANHKAEELSDTKDRDALKAEIKDAINEIMKKEEVKNIYFTQFIVQ